jgi:PAS domain S-box-containing protein
VTISQFAKSLRFKVTLLVIAVELLIFSGVGVFYTHRFSQEIDNAIIARLSIPGLLMTRGELSFDAVNDKRTMEGLLREPYSEGFVIGLDGRVYFSSNPARRETHLDVIDGLRLPGRESSSNAVDAPDVITPVQDSTGTYLTCLSPLRPDGKLAGYLYLKVGTEISEAEKRKVSMLFAIGSLGTIALTAAILTWLLHLMVILRLNSLVEIFRRFARGDYATRAQPTGGDDEIATLMKGFNGLAKRLEDTVAHLSKSEALLNTTQRLTKVGGWEFDVESGKSFWTDELYRIHEIPNDSGIDHVKESLACYAPEERRILNDAFQRACEQGESYDLELPFTTCLGKSLWIRTTAQPVYEGGKVVRLVGNLMDITERKRAEDALRLSSERLQLATRVASIGIWDWDIPKNELVWDESMYQLYGIRRGDFGGAYDAWIRTVHPEDKEYTDGEIQAALRGEREYAPEFRIVRPDGAIRHIKADSRTIKDRQGKPLRMIGTNIDITERKQSEEELRQYKDQLEETVRRRTAELLLARDAAEAANKAKSVFLANMSHELRTPLNAILGFSSLIRRDPQLSQRQRENVEIVNRSGEHLLRLINDVLEIAKIEAGRVQLEVAPFDLGELVRDVVDMMQLRANEKGLKLQIDQASDFPRFIKGDEARMRQILINLVGNAVKFTNEGVVVVRLGVRKNDLLHLLIEVEDSGPGISVEDQKRLFKPFVQLAEGGVQKGTGLGLAITRQFVDLMKGAISVDSLLGRGSVFRVDLPVEPVEASSVPILADTAHGEVLGLAAGQPHYRVLIAEDQSENQLLLNWLMSDIGIEARVVSNGEQCVEAFQEWQPDLIWMDRRMPVMEGEEATRRIRQLPGGDKVKIVAVTASAFKEEQQEMLDAGMDDFIRKPYRPKEIYDCLARLLNIEYRYSAESAAESAPVPLTAAMLMRLPDPLRRELRTAVTSLDNEQIASVLEKVGAVDVELAHALSHLTEYFDYPAILKAIDESNGQLEAQ